MPDIARMEAVFRETLEKFGSANRRLINTYTGNMGRQLDEEKKILKQDMDRLERQFVEARDTV